MLSSLVLLGVATLAQPGAGDHPCRDVIAESRMESDHDKAQSRLGACLASRSSDEYHLRVVAEMAARSLQAGDERAYCRYGKLLEVMLEKAADKALPTALEDGRKARSEIACNCDRLLVDARTAGLDTLSDEFDPLWRPRWQPETPVRTVHDGVETHDDKTYRVLVNQQSGVDRYCVFVDEELRFAESRPALSDGYLESSLFRHEGTDRIHAVVRWLRGDRGEALQIVDMEDGLTLREYSSPLPVDYRIEDGTVQYHYYDNGFDRDSPEKREGRF